MTDYISREALLKMIGTMPSSPITDREERLIRAFISTVKNFPASDVRPVKRGRIEEDENTYLWCSECGCNITLAAYEMPNGNLILRPNFCPNCGADMRSTDCTKTATADEERDVLNVRAWLKCGADMREVDDAR